MCSLLYTVFLLTCSIPFSYYQSHTEIQGRYILDSSKCSRVEPLGDGALVVEIPIQRVPSQGCRVTFKTELTNWKLMFNVAVRSPLNPAHSGLSQGRLVYARQEQRRIQPLDQIDNDIDRFNINNNNNYYNNGNNNNINNNNYRNINDGNDDDDDNNNKNNNDNNNNSNKLRRRHNFSCSSYLQIYDGPSIVNSQSVMLTETSLHHDCLTSQTPSSSSLSSSSSSSSSMLRSTGSYFSSGAYVTLQLRSNDNKPSASSSSSSSSSPSSSSSSSSVGGHLVIVITAFNEDYKHYRTCSGLFKCPVIDKCISNSNLCDDVNNCGDLSDESGDACQSDISIIEALYRRGGVFAFLFIVFGSTALFVVFVICCICYIRSRRLGDSGEQREKYQPHERPNSDLAAGHCISAVQKRPYRPHQAQLTPQQFWSGRATDNQQSEFYPTLPSCHYPPHHHHHHHHQGRHNGGTYSPRMSNSPISSFTFVNNPYSPISSARSIRSHYSSDNIQMCVYDAATSAASAATTSAFVVPTRVGFEYPIHV